MKIKNVVIKSDFPKYGLYILKVLHCNFIITQSYITQTYKNDILSDSLKYLMYIYEKSYNTCT